MKRTLYTLGKIAKTRGYSGVLAVVFDEPVKDEIEDLDEIFILVDGLPVPFPVQEIKLLTDTSAQFQLEFVTNQKEALALVGSKACATVSLLKQKIETDSEQLLGFAVCDSKHGKIGIIKQIEDYKGNQVMQIMNGDKEVLISMYPELITGIDGGAKILHITAPDGYFS